jgi:hypothetical protein
LSLAVQELSYAKKKGLPDEAMQAVNTAQRFIIEAIRVCEDPHGEAVQGV